MKTKKQGAPLITSIHYIRLVYRIALFAAAVTMYIADKVKDPDKNFFESGKGHLLLGIIWVVYALEMVIRSIPTRLESMGCQKQFKQNYIPTGQPRPQLQSWKRTLAVAAAWVMLNGIFGIAYYLKVIDKGVLVLITLAYSVCDMICILFFCPFQLWFMKNRCCNDCRIYNWDYAMMFTPYIFIPHIYTWSLLAMALFILIRWEIAVHRHPERFSEKTNACIGCEGCKEKLCRHRKMKLYSLLKKESVTKHTDKQ